MFGLAHRLQISNSICFYRHVTHLSTEQTHHCSTSVELVLSVWLDRILFLYSLIKSYIIQQFFVIFHCLSFQIFEAFPQKITVLIMDCSIAFKYGSLCYQNDIQEFPSGQKICCIKFDFVLYITQLKEFDFNYVWQSFGNLTQVAHGINRFKESKGKLE